MVLRTLALLLPALFPSWRFFKSVAPSPRIEWRGADGPWREVHPRPAHLSLGQMLRRLFWNPDWNAALYLVSCAEQVVGQTAPGAATRLQARVVEAAPEVTRLRLVFVHREGDALIKAVEYEGALERRAPPP